MDAAAAARTWAEAWERGWRTHDPEPIAARYAEGAVFRSYPFREPQDPREYAVWAFSEEDDDPEVRFGEPIVDGDRAAIEYWAVVRSGGKQTTIAGHSRLRFDEDGLVVEELEYWAEQDGRHEPPPGWGR